MQPERDLRLLRFRGGFRVGRGLHQGRKGGSGHDYGHDLQRTEGLLHGQGSARADQADGAGRRKPPGRGRYHYAARDDGFRGRVHLRLVGSLGTDRGRQWHGDGAQGRHGDCDGNGLQRREEPVRNHRAKRADGRAPRRGRADAGRGHVRAADRERAGKHAGPLCLHLLGRSRCDGGRAGQGDGEGRGQGADRRGRSGPRRGVRYLRSDRALHAQERGAERDRAGAQDRRDEAADCDARQRRGSQLLW